MRQQRAGPMLRMAELYSFVAVMAVVGQKRARITGT